MPKLKASEIKTIRLVADFLVVGEITENVMAKTLKPEQLQAFRNHMKKNCPELFQVGQELHRQIAEAKSAWKQELIKDGV